ncbi:hypothetical protein RUM43_013671 [Polyplax serrata]|uniref:Tetratricopeptide repeat protein 17 n=1 Tax=Polyplax serrata TaxID=468196 RepID=A0AAN8NJC9_POLSC
MTDVPCLTYMALYILSFHVLQVNSRTSTHWKLNTEEGKIVEGRSHQKVVTLSELPTTDDPIFNIIVSTIHYGKSWTKRSVGSLNADCDPTHFDNSDRSLNSSEVHGNNSNKTTFEVSDNSTRSLKKNLTSSGNAGLNIDQDEVLDCGKAVNFTYYDNLVGVNNRNNHPHVPEPQVALILKKKSSKNGDFDVDALERKLKKAKKEKPKSVQLYNQIGNFWRIKGDAQKSIECFRRALAVSPHNAEVLLNLARVLLNLQYLDDAIYLTRRSLEVQPPDKNAWQQYYTLGEIFKAYGHYQEASLHLRHSLELKPEFEPALAALKDMESIPETTIHIYTLLIIICLVLGVLLVILSSVDGNLESDFSEIKTQKHFNRAMAMRSLKMGISPRALRAKRYSERSSSG